MIISASRRTDIPSYYSEWFYRRMEEGHVLVRNPMNIHQVSKISLSPEVVDGIVFWTKNPSRMLGGLSRLKEYTYYFQFTLTPYGNDIEAQLPSKRRIVIPAFKELADTIGPERVIWRYDPILINGQYTLEKHIRYFEMLARILEGYTHKCVISFLDMYRNTAKYAGSLGLKAVTGEDMLAIGEAFSQIASSCHIRLDTCAEIIGLEQFGIGHSSCIDGKLLERLGGYHLKTVKDKNQRGECGCVQSVDIGAYNTCNNGCRYCYANYNEMAVEKNVEAHNPLSPLLSGHILKEDRITDRRAVLLKESQITMDFPD